jgi:hypothetical protein
MSIRWRPKRSASIDHAPGPSIARPTLIERRRIAVCGKVPLRSNVQDCDMTTNTLPTGVQRPISMSSPAAIPTIAGAMASWCGPDASHALQFASKMPPAASRRTSRPLPGQPSGKIENRRCTQWSRSASLCWLALTVNTNQSNLAATLSGV